MNTIISVEIELPSDISKQIAERVRARRLELDLTQEGLATRAGVKLPTYRKFEQTGDISLMGLLRVAFALDCMEDFKHLFATRKYRSMADLLNEKKYTRKRGSQK